MGIDTKAGQFVSYAKGRNGYFDLHHTHCEYGVHGRVSIQFYSRRATWPSTCFAVLTLADAEKLLAQLTDTIERAKKEGGEADGTEGVLQPEAQALPA